MDTQSTILVPLDHSPQSLAAFGYAKVIAKATDCSLTLLYVIEEPGFFTKTKIKKDQKEEIRKEAISSLQKVIDEDKELKNKSIQATPMVKEGKVYKKIIETAQEIKPDFIIMGRSDESDFKKNITGTNTHHIVSEAQAPVITIKGIQEITTKEHILLPLDLTNPIEEKLAKAIEIARYFNAHLSILSVLQSRWLSKRIKAQKCLSRIENILKKYEVSCDTKLIVNKKQPVHDLIIKYAKEIDVDLIMVMTQQEKEIHKFFIGSTAQEIINDADRPVISILPHPEIKLENVHYIFKNVLDPLHVYK
ncbi:MAG: universal stress protein [Bacteroidota bacterium]